MSGDALYPKEGPAATTTTTAAAEHTVDLDIRQTPEYAAAWDLELWKAMQMARVQKELKERERRAMEEMTARVQQREKTDLAHIEKRSRDCAAREAALAKSTEALEKRRAKLKELETALKNQLHETDAFRQRLDAETDARVARVKEEVSHKLEMMHQRLVESQEQVTRADERAANAQKEYLKLWDEFSDFKTRILAQSAPHLSQQLDAMRAQHEANMVMLVERYDRRIAEMQQKSTELQQRTMADLQKASEQLASKRALAKSLQQDLTTALEERDAARAEVRRLTAHVQQLELTLMSRQSPPPDDDRGVGPHRPPANKHHKAGHELRESVARALHNFPPEQHNRAAPRNDAAAHTHREARAEIDRLTAERDSLLRDSGGVYTEDSPVIVDLDHRIRNALRVIAT